MESYTVRLGAAAHEMAREEILKQTAFLSKEISGIRFSEDGSEIIFSAPAEHGTDLVAAVQSLATRIQRSLRSLQRKIVFRSPEMDVPQFSDQVILSDVHFLGSGQVALEGLPFALFKYFDRVFEGFGSPWNAKALMTPTLIPTSVLARCDYFRSFHQYMTFEAH